MINDGLSQLSVFLVECKVYEQRTYGLIFASVEPILKARSPAHAQSNAFSVHDERSDSNGRVPRLRERSNIELVFRVETKATEPWALACPLAQGGARSSDSERLQRRFRSCQ